MAPQATHHPGLPADQPPWGGVLTQGQTPLARAMRESLKAD